MIEAAKTLVYGGTGGQGRAIVQRLIADGSDVRVVTRGGAGLETPAAAEAIVGNFDDTDSLVVASRGCRNVVLLLPLIFDVSQAQRWTANAVDAAKRAGAELLIFDTSAPTPSETTGVAAIDVRLRAEEIVRQSDVPSIVIRPTIYLDNLAAPWSAPGIRANQVVAYPLPAERKVAWTSWDETAAFVSAALSRPDLAGRAFDVGGAKSIDGRELAGAFSRATGAKHGYAEIPLAGFEQGLNAAFGSPVGTEIARLYGWFVGEGRDRVAADSTQARQALSQTSRSVDRWIEHHFVAR